MGQWREDRRAAVRGLGAFDHTLVAGFEGADFHGADEGGLLGLADAGGDEAYELARILGEELDRRGAGDVDGAAADDEAGLGVSLGGLGGGLFEFAAVADDDVEAVLGEVADLVVEVGALHVGDVLRGGLEFLPHKVEGFLGHLVPALIGVGAGEDEGDFGLGRDR
jgi:hypothetical protein